MDIPLKCATPLDTRTLRILLDRFPHQLATAYRYGIGTWMLVTWTEDLWYRWGLGAEVAQLRARLEAAGPVTVVSLPTGLQARLKPPRPARRFLPTPAGAALPMSAQVCV